MSRGSCDHGLKPSAWMRFRSSSKISGNVTIRHTTTIAISKAKLKTPKAIVRAENLVRYNWVWQSRITKLALLRQTKVLFVEPKECLTRLSKLEKRRPTTTGRITFLNASINPVRTPFPRLSQQPTVFCHSLVWSSFHPVAQNIGNPVFTFEGTIATENSREGRIGGPFFYSPPQIN